MTAKASLPLEAEEHLSWLAAERGRSPNTLAAYRRDLNQYVDWLAERHRALGDVEPGDVEAYVAHLRAEGKAPASIARAVVAVRGLHRFALLDGLVPDDVAHEVRPPAPARRLPKAVPVESVVVSVMSNAMPPTPVVGVPLMLAV